MLFIIGDIVCYKSQNSLLELGQIIDVLPNYNYIVKFVIYTKHREIITQEINPKYLYHNNVNNFINNMSNNEIYKIHLENIEKNINNNKIQVVNIDNIKINYKTIPKGVYDAITYEDIKDGDILVDFLRCNNKTENDYDTYYKESTLTFILKMNKNPYTMESIDKNSIVKYIATMK